MNESINRIPELKEVVDKLKSVDCSFSEIPDGMSAASIMGLGGDTKHIWNKNIKEEVDAIKELFKTLIKKGYRAFRVEGKDGEKGELMDRFDPDAERIIFTPPLAGG